MRVLVIGASSFLGKKVVKILKGKGYELIGTYFSKHDIFMDRIIKLDLSQIPLIYKKITEIKPDVIIHIAAMTDINLCEEMKDKALMVNTTSVAHIANWCHEHQSKLIYISTDYVFDGASGTYFERSKPSPINFYGLTKYLAEFLIENLMDDYNIIRPTILYGYNDENDKLTFPVKVIRELRAGNEITVDNFRVKYPTLIDDIAVGILRVIESNIKGILHFSNREPMNRYEWALVVADIFDLPTELIRGAPLDQDIFPPRPKNVELISENLKIRFRLIREGLHLMKRQMEEES